MKRLLVASLFALCGCGDQHAPVVGIYDLTTNTVTQDTPAGCAGPTAAFPMTLNLVQENGGYSLYICGAVNAPNCDQEFLYATAPDGYNFTGGTTAMTATFEIAYDTNVLTHRTTISGTGVTTATGLPACTWDTTFSGTRR